MPLFLAKNGLQAQLNARIGETFSFLFNFTSLDFQQKMDAGLIIFSYGRGCQSKSNLLLEHFLVLQQVNFFSVNERGNVWRRMDGDLVNMVFFWLLL